MQRLITQEDLDANPILVELGAVVGNKCSVGLNDEQQEAKDAADFQE